MRKMKMINIGVPESIPKDWTINKLKFLSSFGKGLSITKKDLKESGAPVISYGQVHAKTNTGTSTTDELIRYVDGSFYKTSMQSVCPYQGFIFADTSEDMMGVGNCVYLTKSDLIFAGYHTLFLSSPSIHNPKYLAYLFKTDFWRYQLRTTVSGVKVYSITKKMLKASKVLIPTPKEQDQIVSYLDAKCALIDESISRQRQVIERLEKYRESIINTTVTKGLNSYINMKDSGTDLIGEIPQNWTINKLKFLSSFGKGLSITKKDLKESGVPVISYGQVHAKTNSGTSTTDDLIRYIDESFCKTSKQSICPQYGFIFADTSEDILGVGNCVYLTNSNITFAGYHTLYLSRPSIHNPKYLAYLFKTDFWRYQLRTIVSGVKVYSITKRILKSAKVIIPTSEEQDQIVSYLDHKCTLIDDAISRINAIIEKLAEYRKSIIYHAVTGKIDCRKELTNVR